VEGEGNTYRSLSIKIPRCRRHILGNVRIDFLSIFIEFSRRKPCFTRLLQLNLLAVVLPGLKCHCNPHHTSLKNTQNSQLRYKANWHKHSHVNLQLKRKNWKIMQNIFKRISLNPIRKKKSCYADPACQDSYTRDEYPLTEWNNSKARKRKITKTKNSIE